jgi:hypothetical protein
MQVLEVMPHGRCGDKRALALLAHHELLADKLLDRLPESDATDRKSQAKNRFRFQAMARRETSAADAGFEMACELPVQGLGAGTAQRTALSLGAHAAPPWRAIDQRP